MVQVWKTGKGDDFACPHCKAVYEVTIRRFPTRDSDYADCHVCGDRMQEWNSTSVPSFRLKRQPENG